MAIPPTAFRWTQAMDPADTVDYVVEVGGASGLLDIPAGEGIASYTLTLGAEAVALGLTIGTGGYAITQPTSTSYRIWFSINISYQSNAAFDGAGSALPLVLKITTDSSPARIRERTLLLQVAQQ